MEELGSEQSSASVLV